jgi:hypothetical protein
MAPGSASRTTNRRVALDQRADRRSVVRSHDQVAFPVPELDAVFDLVRALMHHRHRRQAPAPLQAGQPPSATTATRGTGELDGRVIDRLIDRFHAQAPAPLTGGQRPQLMRDLLRAPALSQQPRDGPGQHGIGRQPPQSRPPHPGAGGVLGSMRSVAPVRVAVAADFTADGRW